MELKKVKELAELMEQKNLTRLSVTDKDCEIHLERAVPCSVQPAATARAVPTPVPMVAEPAPTGPNDECREIKSPMVGVFYGAPSPDDKPFVSVGDKIKKGDVLCIIEAMKLMNEITSDVDGEIIEICADNEQLVEYGQCLFRLK